MIRSSALIPATLLAALLLAALGSTASAENFFTGAARARAIEQTARLREIQSRHVTSILAVPGVTIMGIGLDRPRSQLLFVIGADPEAAAPPVLPAEIEGVRVRVMPLGRPQLTNGAGTCATPCHDDLFVLPVEMGNSARTEALSAVGGCFAGACTLGFKACSLDTLRFVYVTNAHCSTSPASSCPASAGVGAPTYHRSPLDAAMCTGDFVVGSTAREIAPACGASNLVDAASVESESGQTEFGIRDIGVPSAYPGIAVAGDEVQKSGRTTGHTDGLVVAVGASFQAAASDYCCAANVQFDDQILIQPVGATNWALKGDSGSAVLDTATPPAVVGLNFAMLPAFGLNFGIANTIGNVMSALDLSLNPLDCTTICAASEAAKGTDDPPGLLDAAAGFRDTVLARSQRGRQFIELYYAVTADVVALMFADRVLLADTAALFERYRWLIEGASAGAVTVRRADIEVVDALLRRYVEAADPELRRALRRVSRGLHNPGLLREFGVTVVR